jgi:GNAT superfamily N-acetyltransferase
MATNHLTLAVNHPTMAANHRIRLRPLTGDHTRDLIDLLDVLGRCSAGSRYERFFTETVEAGRQHVHTLLADPDAYTVVAERQRFGGAQPAGFGSLFFDGPDEAEVALLVADDYQRQGVGTALAEHLCRQATALGVPRLRLTALARNRRIARLFRRCAPAVEFDLPDAGTVTATIRLAAAPTHQLAAA